MPLHDRFLRRTPFEQIFPDDESRTQTLDAIGREIEERGEGGDDPGAFALLTATRRALAELRDREAEDDGGHTHAILLFHAFHLQRAGLPHFLASVPACRWAVETTPDGGPARDAGFPAAAYVQLPQYLFWVRESPEDRPLALDGFFWTRRGGELHLLGVVDVPGGALRVLPLPGVPWADRETWLQETMREEGEDFRSEIPGAELEGLYEVRTAGELLKLAARLEDLLRHFPDGVVTGEAGEAKEDGPAQPVPSPLAYRALSIARREEP